MNFSVGCFFLGRVFWVFFSGDFFSLVHHKVFHQMKRPNLTYRMCLSDGGIHWFWEQIWSQKGFQVVQKLEKNEKNDMLHVFTEVMKVAPPGSLGRSKEC